MQKTMDISHGTGKAIIGSNVFINTLAGTTNANLVPPGYFDRAIGITVAADESATFEAKWGACGGAAHAANGAALIVVAARKFMPRKFMP